MTTKPLESQWLATPAATTFRPGESESTKLSFQPRLQNGVFRYEFINKEVKNDVAAVLQALRFAASQVCSQSALMNMNRSPHLSPSALSGHQVDVLRRNFVRVDMRPEIAKRLEEGSRFREDFELFEQFVVNEPLIQFLSLDVHAAAAEPIENSFHILDLLRGADFGEGEEGQGAVRRTIKLSAILPSWAA